MDTNFLKKLKITNHRFVIDDKYKPAYEASGGPTRNPDDVKIASVVPKLNSAGGGSSQAELSSVDLTQIGQAYYSDSYISRAINKIVGLMFKAGWNFSSLNADALNYIETRFKLIEESTHMKTNELLREIGLNYVLYANAVIVKTRGTENTGSLNYQGYYTDEPISGLFSANPEFFSIIRDEFGNIESYEIGEGSELIELSPEDVFHMTYQKPSGLAFGVPYITNVVRDVLVLRQLEQTVVNILYRNLHPLHVYKVGLAEPGMEAREGEIEAVEENIANSPLDSMFIVPERHSIEAIKNDYLDASDYLKYFRQRVFTGLGVSESTMGVGDTANRSTSDNQSSDLIDLVKDFQQNFANQIQKLIDEFLFEGGYDPTLNPEDIVSFEFTEIEHSAKIARENHEIQKFLQNTQSLDETRLNMGYEPTDDLSRFYANLFKNNNSNESENKTVDNKNQPENQHGKQDAPVDAAFKSTNIDEFKQDLTKTAKGVKLQAGGNKMLEKANLLSNGWQLTCDIAKKDKDFSVKAFKDSLIDNLDSSLFSSNENKISFINFILEQVTENGLVNIESDAFYHFEEFIKTSYQAFEKIS